MLKKTALISGFAAAVMLVLLLLVPQVNAAPNEDSAITDCTASNGQPGITTAIGLGGERCIPIGGTDVETNPIMVYMLALLRIISALVGIAVVGGFVWGGVLYITARANAGQVEKAKLVMINATIGLLLFVFMYAILEFLVPGGLFT